MLHTVGLRVRLPKVTLPGFATRFLGRVHGRTPLVRALLLGGASALLPCGFLYGFALAGAATGSPLGGALVMAALWAGNLPALLGFGLALSTALSRIKRHIPLLSAASVFALGVLTLTSRVSMPALARASAVAATTSSTAVSAPRADDCPCHHRHAP
jgi:sulfite exporter TauE/SafE